MNTGAMRLVFAVVIAAIFFGCVLLSIEGKMSFLQISAGFFTVAIAGFVLANMRLPILYAVAALVCMVMIYVAYKMQWQASVYGALAGLLVVALVQIGWIGADQRTLFKREDYAKEQARIREQEGQGSRPQGGGPGAQGQA